MTTSTMNPIGTTTANDCTIGSQVSFDCITRPGAYVCNATGHLVRIHEGFDANTMNAWCNWSGNQPFWFTCVSTDSCCGVEECRSNATNAGIDCCF